MLDVCADGCEELFGGVDLLDGVTHDQGGRVAVDLRGVEHHERTRHEPWPAVELHRPPGCFSSPTVRVGVFTFHHTHPVPRSPLRTCAPTAAHCL